MRRKFNSFLFGVLQGKPLWADGKGNALWTDKNGKSLWTM